MTTALESLGFGPRFCVGAALARLEGATAFPKLAQAYPDMALAVDEFEWVGPAMLRKPIRVLIRLGA